MGYRANTARQNTLFCDLLNVPLGKGYKEPMDVKLHRGFEMTVKLKKVAAGLMLTVGCTVGALALADDPGQTTDPTDLDQSREEPAPPAPEGVTVRQFAYAGTGCPAGSLSGELPVGGTTFLLGWETFYAEVGPGLPLSASRKNCQINLDLGYPEGWQYAVKSLSYGGTFNVAAGVSAVVASAFYFQGAADTVRFDHETVGPLVQDFATVDVVADEELRWSACGATRSLNLNVQARVAANAHDLVGYARFGEDANGSVPSVLTLVWRPCSVE